jgi:hypothetical protein
MSARKIDTHELRLSLVSHNVIMHISAKARSSENSAMLYSSLTVKILYCSNTLTTVVIIVPLIGHARTTTDSRAGSRSYFKDGAKAAL